MSAVPAALKPLSGLLRQARAVRAADPVLSYYLFMWTAQKGLQLRAAQPSPEATRFLGPLLDECEEARQAVELPENPQEYVAQRACKAFLYADDRDRAGARDKGTAAAFRAAAHTFECLKQFGELPAEIQTRQKYSVWRASHIMTKLSAGETPDPPLAASPEEEELNALSQAAPVGAPEVQSLKFFDTLNEDISAAEKAKAAAASAAFPAPPRGEPSFPSPPNAQPQFPTSPSAQPQFPTPPSPQPQFPAAPGSGGSGGPAFPDVPSRREPLFPSTPHTTPNTSQPSLPAASRNEPGSLLNFPSAPHQPPAPGSDDHDPFNLPSVPTNDRSSKPPPPVTIMPPEPKPPAATFGGGGVSKPPSHGAKKPSNNDDDSSSSEYDTDDSYVPYGPAPTVRFGQQPPGYVPTMQSIALAQKHSKTVYSALNFDDVDTAVRDLCIALKALTGTDFEMQVNRRK